MKNEFIKLVQSLDPLFPIGGFTLSNGMETYVQNNAVYDEKTLVKHLKSYLYILSFNELAFAALAYKGHDIKRLDMLCSAYRAPMELRNGSVKQCMRFLKLHSELGSYPKINEYLKLIWTGKCEGHYSIAMGLFIKDLGINLEESLELYCYNIISSMTNHAAKLVPLRQLDAQRALMTAAEGISRAVGTAVNVSEDELGASGTGFDLSSMRHERLYSRIYIS